MKATGIVRRIDDLGRVVIPKEIRRTLKIYEGCPLEIYTEDDGSVVFKKYSGVKELSSVAQVYMDALSLQTGQLCCICDTEKIIASSGVGRKALVGLSISANMMDKIMSRKFIDGTEKIEIDESGEKTTSNLRPIIAGGDAMGAVFVVDGEKTFEEKNMLKLISEIISRQSE